MSDNLAIWREVQTPPESALKKISGGPLNGKSDINPVWRMEAMTATFGPCGFGWKYEIVKEWETPMVGSAVVMCFVRINLYVFWDGKWSEPIPGVGGSTLVDEFKSGAKASDEGWKMATTDALSVAMKALGVAADVYRNFKIRDSKYEGREDDREQPRQERSQPRQEDPRDKKLVDAAKRDFQAEEDAPREPMRQESGAIGELKAAHEEIWRLAEIYRIPKDKLDGVVLWVSGNETSFVNKLSLDQAKRLALAIVKKEKARTEAAR